MFGNGLGIEPQTVSIDSIDMGLPANKGDRETGTRQHATEKTTHRASAHDRKSRFG
jgi:hypothetical protein